MSGAFGVPMHTSRRRTRTATVRYMRPIAAAVLLVVGVLAGMCGVAVFVLLTRSPDSGWINGAANGGPFVLGGMLGLSAAVQLLRGRQ